jgi:lysophospholipase L1-like esterase
MGDFSLGLIKLQASQVNSYLWLDFRSANDPEPKMKSVDLLFDTKSSSDSSTLVIEIDNIPQKVNLDSKYPSKLRINTDYPFSTLKIRLVQGGFNLHGIIPQYTTLAKLYLDNLAIPGSTAKAWTNLQPIKEFMPPYDLIFLEYGTNEGNNPSFDRLTYQNDLRLGLQNFRALYPNASCVLIGPTDRGVLVRSHKKSKKTTPSKLSVDLFRYAHIHAQIASIQLEEANIAGCSFWDWQKAMGGPGSSYLWAYEKPALITKDLTHLSIQGYQKSARQFSTDFGLKALLNP